MKAYTSENAAKLIDNFCEGVLPRRCQQDSLAPAYSG